MLRWANSDGLRAAGYLAIAVASVLAARREQRRRHDEPYLWPTFWWMTAALFGAMAVARFGDLANLIADLGRREAYESGWYPQRRRFQAMVVGAIGLGWALVIGIALWRVPERRRRYLPMAIMTFTIMCFGAVRMISLHQIDSILYRRYLEGAKVGAVIEVIGLAVAFAVTFWQPIGRRAGSVSSEAALDHP